MPRVSANRSTVVRDTTAIRIRAEREAAGWTFEDLANALVSIGCPMYPATVWKIENAGRSIHVDEAVAFARAFGIPLGSLLLGSFDPVDAAERRCLRIMCEATA